MENKDQEYDDRDMTVDITLEDESVVSCSIETILEVSGKEYIALHPNFTNPEAEETIWFYGYSENPDDTGEEPKLTYIEDDDEYDAVCDAYDEWLDTIEFEDMDE